MQEFLATNVFNDHACALIPSVMSSLLSLTTATSPIILKSPINENIDDIRWREKPSCRIEVHPRQKPIKS